MRTTAGLLLLIFAGCNGGTRRPRPITPASRPSTPIGDMLRDSHGRALLLRGVNARVAGVFDVTFDDGRAPREAIPDRPPMT